MKIALFLLLVLSANSYASFDRFSFSAAGASREQQTAIDHARFWQLGESKFYVGAGVRGTHQSSSGQGFKTAPARLTTGQEGPQVIFQGDKKKNIDDLRFNSSEITSINVALHLLYQWTEKWSFGANIDFIGGSFGKKQKARYNPKRDDEDYPDKVSASPTPFNLLLISDNDLGSLNSEFYTRRDLGNGWGLKLAANFAFTEYTTHHKLRNNNDRFRKKSLLPSLGLTKDF